MNFPPFQENGRKNHSVDDDDDVMEIRHNDSGFSSPPHPGTALKKFKVGFSNILLLVTSVETLRGPTF